MSKQKEDVLLMVKHVRLKKVDGSLYVNSGRVAWRNQTSNSFRISAAFEDIRMQRISPDAKEKVQLQLLMHNGESYTFQFADPAGKSIQLQMRNSVKELLQTLLSKFKDKAHSELKEKYRLLDSNPQLLALYRELVVTGLLSSEEFWARPEFTSSTDTAHSQPVPTKHGQSQDSTSEHPSGQLSQCFQQHQNKLQAVGVPNYLLSDIKPEADGANGIKYNLTHETIEAIFLAYPMVRQRHKDLVPDTLSEADFWIKFFQSHYFHRDRVHLPKDDIFTECAIQDERQLSLEARRSRRARLLSHLDLSSFIDHDVGSGYGCSSDYADAASVTTDSNSGIAFANGVPSANSSNATGINSGLTPLNKLSANQLLLRRSNNHSIMVLKSLSATDANHSVSHNPGEAAGLASQPTPSAPCSSYLRRHVYPDELDEPVKTPVRELHLTRVEDYLEGPVAGKLGGSNSLSGGISSSSSGLKRSTDLSKQQQHITALRIQELNKAALSRFRARLSDYVNKRRRLSDGSTVGLHNSSNIPSLGATLNSPHARFGGAGRTLTAINAQLALTDVSPGGILLGGKPKTSLGSVGFAVVNESDGLSSSVKLSVGPGGSVTNMSGRRSLGFSGHHHQPVLLNPDQSRELNMLYSGAAELLRHFWACFPVTTSGLAHKLDRIAASLIRFRSTKLAQFAASVSGGAGSVGSGNASSVSATSNVGNSIGLSAGGVSSGGSGGTLNLAAKTTSIVSSTGAPTGPGCMSATTSGVPSSGDGEGRVTGHLEAMLDAAEQKYAEWKARKRR